MLHSERTLFPSIQIKGATSDVDLQSRDFLDKMFAMYKTSTNKFWLESNGKSNDLYMKQKRTILPYTSVNSYEVYGPGRINSQDRKISRWISVNRKPVLLFACVIGLVIWYILARDADRELYPYAPKTTWAEVDEYLAIKKEDKKYVTPLVSRADFWGLPRYLKLSKESEDSDFNPSLLLLGSGSDYAFVGVARGREWNEQVSATEWQANREMLGALVPDFTLQSQALQARWDPKKQIIVQGKSIEKLARGLVDFSGISDFGNCDDNGFGHWYRHTPGPEDPRLFYTGTGAPLMIYNAPGKENTGRCRQQYLIDLRDVYPPVETVSSRSFGTRLWTTGEKSIGLVRPAQTEIEKNWAPFIVHDGHLYMHTDLVPQRVDRVVPGQENLISVVDSTSYDNCLSRALNDTRPDGDAQLHQASPLLHVLLCSRADHKCTLKSAKSLLLGLVHIRHYPWTGPGSYYERRIVTWNPSPPFAYHSFSKPLSYLGVDSSELIFTVSLTIKPKTLVNHAADLSIGYLDDDVVMTFGRGDGKGGFVVVELNDLLYGQHTLCDNI